MSMQIPPSSIFSTASASAPKTFETAGSIASAAPTVFETAGSIASTTPASCGGSLNCVA